MSKAPTQGERADFAGFCRNATDTQLVAIIAKESAARRLVYARIAQNADDGSELIADHTDNEFCNRVWECWERS